MDQPVDFSYLYSKRGTMKLGLERIHAAAQELAIDLVTKPRILVAGTNGKGSTAGFLWQILRSHYGPQSVGLFTSPHLRHFRERFQVGDQPVADQTLAEELDQIRSSLYPELFDQLSFFEINTLLALRVFERVGTHIDIMEVGLGGRLDSTNICQAKASVITTIGHDHEEFLGSTMAAIAGEKAGIIKPRTPVFWGEPHNTEADQVIRRQAAAQDAPLHRLAREEIAASGAPADWPYYLRQNYALAQKVAQHWGVDLPPAAHLGARPYCLRGRFQRLLWEGSPYLVDGCHNPEGVMALVQALQSGPKRPALVSILADKPVAKMVRSLQVVCEPIVMFPTSDPRSLTREQVTRLSLPIIWHENFAEAKAYVRQRFPDEEVIICGSLRAIGETVPLGEA